MIQTTSVLMLTPTTCLSAGFGMDAIASKDER